MTGSATAHSTISAPCAATTSGSSEPNELRYTYGAGANDTPDGSGPTRDFRARFPVTESVPAVLPWNE